MLNDILSKNHKKWRFVPCKMNHSSKFVILTTVADSKKSLKKDESISRIRIDNCAVCCN